VVKYDKDEIKNSLTVDDVIRLVAELGGEPIMAPSGTYFTARTICHNVLGEGSHKLYYYDNTKLFQCYTDCAGSFDIYELVQKVKNTNEEFKVGYTKDGPAPRAWQLYDAVEFVAIYFGFSGESMEFQEMGYQLEDWKIFDKVNQRQQKIDTPKQIIELTKYDDSILKYLPRPRILSWEEEGITNEVMKNRGIAFDPRTQSIVIPHWDIDNNLVGIRERTLVKEDEKYGKYKPAILNGKMYNHPLGFNLYNLNYSKDAIQSFKKAIVFEGEKSPLLYASYFGEENDITVATCGNNLLNYQVQLLMSLGVEEIIIAYDKQFKESGDPEWQRLKKNLVNIHLKYGAYVQISYMFDKEDLLDYKDSPIDKGPEVFLKLFQNRITL
jgi:hypothetical protein